MSKTPNVHLTTKDFTVLEGMLDREVARDAATGRLLRRKLASATVVFREDISPQVATINSHVEYRINDGPIETRILVHGGESAFPGRALPISTLRGLALLGLMENDTIMIEASDGKPETLRVERVAYQPEAARKERNSETVMAQDGRAEPNKPVVIDFAARRKAGASNLNPLPDSGNDGPDPHDDDPGPQAA